MKVALIDNMNNSFFAFARYLSDECIEAYLFCLDNVSKHFSPEADSFSKLSSLKYIFQLEYKKTILKEFLFCNRQLKKSLESYDIIIACGPMIAILEKNNIKVDIAIPYGWDLYSFPFFKFNYKSPIKSLINWLLARYQRKGLFNSRVMIADINYDLNRLALEKLDISTYYYPGIPMVYTKEVESKVNLDSQWSFLEEHDFIVFNHSRQWWKTKGMDVLIDFDKYGGTKRNDKLIEAFAEFIKKSKFKKPILILFEYGIDVEASKELINVLNISEYVRWMPTMDRKDIMLGLYYATFTSNAFRQNDIDIGGVCYESLACGTCHLNNFEDIKHNKNILFHDAPMIHALSKDEILNIFIDYESNPKKYEKLALDSKKWFDEKLGLGLVKKYIKLMELLIEDQSIMGNHYKVKEILDK